MSENTKIGTSSITTTTPKRKVGLISTNTNTVNTINIMKQLLSSSKRINSISSSNCSK